MAQQLLLAVEELDAQRVARARQAYGDLGLDRAGVRGHDHHAVGEIHGFGHVVRHVDHRLSRLPPHLRQQPLHVVARESVERGERLVHEQHGRIVGQRPGNGDPLLHAPGEMVRKGVGEFLQLHQPELLQRDLLALLPGHALHLQPEGDVAQRGAPGEQLGEILEHDPPVEPLARNHLPVDADLAAGGRKEAGDDVEQGGLAAAAGADQAQELGRLDRKARRGDAGDAAGRGVVGKRDVANLDVRHGRVLRPARAPRQRRGQVLF